MRPQFCHLTADTEHPVKKNNILNYGDGRHIIIINCSNCGVLRKGYKADRSVPRTPRAPKICRPTVLGINYDINQKACTYLYIHSKELQIAAL